jgi:hypothetical protein
LPILNQIFFSLSVILHNCSSIVVTGCQSNKSLLTTINNE